MRELVDSWARYDHGIHRHRTATPNGLRFEG